MAQQDGGHVVLHHPIEADLRVDLGIVICCEEAIAIQAARGHENEDTKGCIAKTKSLWKTSALELGVHTDHQVNLVDIVVVNAAQLLYPGGIAGQFLEALERTEMHQFAKRIIPGNPPFAVPQDLSGCQIDDAAIRLYTALEITRIIMQGDGAGVGGAERVEEVGHGYLLCNLSRMAVGNFRQGALQKYRIVRHRTEGEFIGHQRMHAVDGNELFCYGIRHAKVICGRTWNAADDFALAETPKVVVNPLAGQSPPVAS